MCLNYDLNQIAIWICTHHCCTSTWQAVKC